MSFFIQLHYIFKDLCKVELMATVSALTLWNQHTNLPYLLEGNEASGGLHILALAPVPGTHEKEEMLGEGLAWSLILADSGAAVGVSPTFLCGLACLQPSYRESASSHFCESI